MNRSELKKLAKEEEAHKIQFIIGEICWKIENMVGEIKSWEKVLTNESYVGIHVQNKKTHLRQLLHQKTLFTEALTEFIQTGEISEQYEVVRTSEKLNYNNQTETLEQMLEDCLKA